MKAIIDFEKLIIFESIDTFKKTFLPLHNENLMDKGLQPVRDEQEIIDLFLDKMNEWKQQIK